MSTAGLPSPNEDAIGALGPEPKLSPDQGALRAPRPKPARFNGRIAALLAGSAAVFVAGAIFVPPMFAHKKAAKGDTTAHAIAVAPIDALSYDQNAADPTTAAPGVDCAQYPGMPGCAAANAAASQAGAVTPTVNPPGAAGAQQAAGQPVGAGLPGTSPQEAARTSGLFFGGPIGGAGSALASIGDRGQAEGQPPVAAQPPAPLLAPPSSQVGATSGKEPADVMSQNGQGEKSAFARQTMAQDYVSAKLEKPQSPYEVKAGSVIPAALMTEINSDLPGEIVAQVTQPVYDHVTGHYVLIPQGSRIIGRYDSQIAYGQNRAMIVWHRVIFPNGNSINFGNMNGTDPTGAAGVADRVNDHFGQLARGIVLSTLLSVGSASAQDAQARSSGTLVLNSGTSGLANEAQNVGSRIAERDMNRQPTIVIRQGAQVRVLVDKDMVLEPYSL